MGAGAWGLGEEIVEVRGRQCLLAEWSPVQSLVRKGFLGPQTQSPRLLNSRFGTFFRLPVTRNTRT